MTTTFRRTLTRFILLFLLPATILMTLWTATPVGAALLYQVVDLGAPGDFSTATGINNSGEVVGGYSTQLMATSADLSFYYSNGTLTDAGAFGGTSSQIGGINDTGEMVGRYRVGGVNHVFTFSSGVFADLGSLGYSVPTPKAINNAGQFVGADLPSSGGGHAFFYSSAITTDLGAGEASTIDNNGVVYGSLASGLSFSYANGVLTEGGYNYILGTNDIGQLAGNYGNDAAIYSGGVLNDLGELGGLITRAEDINNNGWAVGSNGLGGPTNDRAFLYAGDGPLLDLNSLLIPGSGWTVFDAVGINDENQIVGDAVGPDGNVHAVLLNPVPEPASLAMLTFGAGIFLTRRRW